MNYATKKVLLFMAFFHLFLPGISAQQRKSSSPIQQGDRISTGRTPYANWGGLIIESFVPVPNPTKGAFGGEAVQIRYRDDPEQKIDLSGFKIRTDTGSCYTLPSGTVLQGGQYLLVDFSGGEVKVDPQIRQESGTLFLVAAGFQNDFFQNGIGDGRSDMLAIVDSKGTVVEAVRFSEGRPLPGGDLIDKAVSQHQWRKGDSVPQGDQDPLDGDIYYTRAHRDAVDTNTWEDWGPAPTAWPEPTPGSDRQWYNNGQRTYEESMVRGRVLIAPSGQSPESKPAYGAMVRLPGTPYLTSTDQDGFFSFANIPPGNHLIAASAPGCVPLWRVLRNKNPHRPFNQDLVLTPVNASNTVNVTVGPQGGIVHGPTVDTESGKRPAFILTLHPNPNIPFSFDITWLEGGYHSVGLQSEALKKIQVFENGEPVEVPAYRGWESLGGVYTSMHLPSPPGGGPVGELLLLYQEPFPGSKVGDYILVEGLDSRGQMEFVAGEEAFPDGELVEKYGVLYSQAVVPHLSKISNWRETTTEDGKSIWYRYGAKTMDQDGNGTVDPSDSWPFCFGSLCSRADSTTTLTWSARVTTTKSRGKNGGISDSFEEETGKILGLFAKGKINAGNFVDWSTANATSAGVTLSGKMKVRFLYDLQVPPPPDPPDELRKCAYLLFQIIDLNFGMCTYPYPSDIHICTDPSHDPDPDVSIAVPAGVDYTREIEGHCP